MQVESKMRTHVGRTQQLPIIRNANDRLLPSAPRARAIRCAPGIEYTYIERWITPEKGGLTPPTGTITNLIALRVHCLPQKWVEAFLLQLAQGTS
jgi:hypothetical protein